MKNKTNKTSKFEWTLNNITAEKIISAPIFLEISALLYVRHCPKLKKYDDATLIKRQKH